MAYNMVEAVVQIGAKGQRPSSKAALIVRGLALLWLCHCPQSLKEGKGHPMAVLVLSQSFGRGPDTGPLPWHQFIRIKYI